VAVHGLNFKGNPNYAQETWTKGDKLWLKDFLPVHLPKPARVMLFAYNSSPAIDASAIKLDDHAKNLLQWLNLERIVSDRLCIRGTFLTLTIRRICRRGQLCSSVIALAVWLSNK
jgi:hypothetical protein